MTQDSTTQKTSGAGTVFLIGAGPGDPGLITVRGLEKIRTADAVVYDYLASPALLNEARPDAELIYVGKKGKDHTLEQDAINDLLIAKALEGKSIARLKGGDPFVFGRGGEEAEELVRAGVPFEVVPGVTSAVAAPAYAGIPVTHRDHASMVMFITGHEDPTKEESAIDWEVPARCPGTLVFLMGVKNLPYITECLMKHGKPADTPAALVRWGTTPNQVSLVSTLKKIPHEAEHKGIKPPAVLIVGSVAGLHDTLAWYENKPFFGKRILITRSREQSVGMARQISEKGGEPVLFPTITIQPPADTTRLDEAIEKIAEYDWVIFTSVNGVERFFQRFLHVRCDVREMAGPRIAAIGPVTAAAVQGRGIKVQLLAKEFTAEGLLAGLPEERTRGKRFLIPRAEKARDVLPEGIAAMGGLVDVVPVYRTCVSEVSDVEKVRDMLQKKRIHAVTFTSSSTVRHFVEILGRDSVHALTDGAVLASIGPITSRTMKEEQLPVHVEASKYTIAGLVNALAGHFSRSFRDGGGEVG